MNTQEAQALLDKIVGQIFGYKNPYTLDQFQQKYAFDVRLPVKVNDSTTGVETWAQSISSGKFITIDNARKMDEDGALEFPKQEINSISELLKIWEKTNYTTTERQIESVNVGQSDNTYNSENIFRCLNTQSSKNILFSDGMFNSEYVAGSQRTKNTNYCIRVDDSKDCSNSFTVAWSGKVVNSMFINDCYDMYECLFCNHLSSKKYWIANMPFEEAEYLKIKEMILRWILSQ